MKHVVSSFFGLAAAVALIACTGSVHAELLVYESFEHAEAGLIRFQDGFGDGFDGYYVDNGYSSSTTPRAPTSVVISQESRMVYASGDISVDGGFARMKMQQPAAKNGLTWGRTLAGLQEPQDGGPIYFSFLFRVSESCTRASDEDSLLIGITTATGNNPIFGLNVSRNSTSTGNALGLRDYDDNAAGSGTLVADHVYLVVFKWSKIDGYYQKIEMTVDPSTATEPAEWDMSKTVTLKKNLSEYRALSCYVRSSCETEDVFELDEFRIGTSWTDVTCQGTYNGKSPKPFVTTEDDGTSVTMTASYGIPGYTIHYTADGTAPTAASVAYESPIAVFHSTLFKIVAASPSGILSDVVLVPCNFKAAWTGQGDDGYWNTAANWSPTGSPANKALVFGNDDRTAENTINSRIAADVTVRALSFNNWNQSPAASGRTWHHLNVADGKTLSVSGFDENGQSLSIVYPETTNKEYESNVRMSGGGMVDVDSPDSDIVVATVSSSGRGYAKLYCDGLSRLTANVRKVVIGRGRRSNSSVQLPLETASGAPNRIVAEAVYIGDSQDDGETYGGNERGQSSLVLGRGNEVFADRIFVGAGSGERKLNVLGGKLVFNSSVTSGTGSLKIRGRNGTGRADFLIGGNGDSLTTKNTPRSVLAEVSTYGHTVDAMLGALVVGSGRQGLQSTTRGSVTSVFDIGAGNVDALAFTNAITRYGSDLRANQCAATVSVRGGSFSVAGDAVLGINEDGGGTAVSLFRLDGGSADFSGNVFLAVHNGGASNVTSSVEVESGTLTVLGSMASGNIGAAQVTEDGKTYDAHVEANVSALGGVIAVTNVAGTSELRIEHGTLALQGGKVYADSLVLTNAASGVEVLLSGDGFATAEVGKARLGGSIKVSVADGFKPNGASVWTIVEGTQARDGTFAEIDVPEGFRVQYTPTGFMIANKSGLAIIIR